MLRKLPVAFARRSGSNEQEFASSTRLTRHSVLPNVKARSSRKKDFGQVGNEHIPYPVIAATRRSRFDVPTELLHMSTVWLVSKSSRRPSASIEKTSSSKLPD